MACLAYECIKTTVGKVAVAAGTTEILTAVIDMAGFDELEYLVFLGDQTSGSVITFAAKENTASSTSSPTPTSITLALGYSNTIVGVITSGNLVVTAAASDTDNKLVRIALKKSAMTKRYQFLSITPATQNAALVSCTIHQYAARTERVTQHADVISTAYAAA